MVATGMLIGMAVIFRSLGIMVPVAGAAAMRISIDGVFYKLPGLLFGPAYGAMAAGLADIIAYIVHPMGAYIPLMTLTTILNGFLPAILYKYLKRANSESLEKKYIYVFTTLGILGILNILLVTLMPNAFMTKNIIALGKKSQFAQIGLLIISVIGFIPVLINKVIKHKIGQGHIYDSFLSIVTAIGIPALIVSTVNTYILKLFINGLAGKAFMMIWIPRILEQLLIIPIESYIIAILMFTYGKFVRVKAAK